jgi:neopullulanase
MRHARHLFSLVIALCAFTAFGFAQTVSKVEPPNWWSVKKPTALELLFTGSNLAGATVRTTAPGVKIMGTQASADGGYLFCEVMLETEAKPGKIAFDVTSDGKSVKAEWSLLAPPSHHGNFQGLTRSDTLYLLMIDRFADGDPKNNDPLGEKTFDPNSPRAYHGGDIRGVIKHLDYLKELGVTAVWMTPVYNNNDKTGADYHGYGMMDFYAVEEHFGTMAEYQELAHELHKRGMKLIQDIVPNHTGPMHPWVAKPPTPTWFNGTPSKHLDCNFDIPTMTKPDATPEARALVTDGWFAGILPDLNANDPHYARYAIQNTIWWTNMSGQDALRLDTYPYVARPFWRDWQKAMDDHFPTMTQIGEVWNGDAKVISFYRGGKTQWDGIDTGLKTQFDFPLFYAIRDFTCDDKQEAKRVTNELLNDPLYGDASMNVTFIGNHDVNRIMRQAKGDARRVKLAYAILLSLRGIPQLYAGDEIGLDGGDDPDNRRDFPGGFGGDNNAFTKSGRTPEQAEMWNLVHELLKIRRAHPALQSGAHKNLLVEGRTWAFLRSDGKEKLVIVANGTAEAKTVRVPGGDDLPKGKTLHGLHGSQATATVGENGLSVSLEPFGCQIFLVK